jgi:hypothetical protein
MSLTGILLRAASYFSRDTVNGRVYPTNVADSLIVGSTQFDDAGGTDRDFRLFFNKAKGAFRAGRVTGTQWNNASVGVESAAFGLDCTASGANSFACGITATASAVETFAQGQATANASGATAFGGSTASGVRAFAANASTASGGSAFAAGNGTTASGDYSTALGQGGTAAGRAATALGESASAPRFGQIAAGASFFAAAGDGQAARYVARRQTSGATPAVLLFDGGAITANAVTLTGANTNVLTVPVSKAHRFTINAVARRTDTPGTFGGWTITGTLVRSSSGNARFIGTPTVVTDLDAGAATWTLAVAVNTSNATNNYLEITATGEAGATIRWVAEISTAEVG